MTISSATNRVVYTGAGSVGPFAVPFYFLENDDLLVIKTLIADGSETTLVLTTDYTLTGAGDLAGGALTLTSAHGALSSSYNLTIVRDPDRLQTIDYTPYDSFPAETHERGQDKLTMLVQRVYDLITRSLRLPDGLTGISTVLPVPVANGMLAWNAAKTAIVNVLTAGTLTVTAFIETLLDDADAATARTTLGIPTMTPPEQFLRKNAIINGDMTIAQRGTSFAAVADGTYTLDRWVYSKSGAMVHTITQDTDVPTVAQAGRLFTYSLKAALTTADTALAATDRVHLETKIEGYNWRALAQRIVTVSFWIKSPITGIHCAYLRNSVDRSIVKEFTVNVVNTWEKKTLTFAASPSAGTWNYTNSTGVRFGIVLAMGSTFHTTADAWQTGDFMSTANQVNGVNTGITPYFITGVQLEAGSVATEFEGRSFAEEYLLCMRYYQKTFLLGTAPAQNVGGDSGNLVFGQPVSAGNTAYYGARFPVPMRAAPTMVTYNPQAGNAEIRNANTATDYSSTAMTPFPNGFRLSATAPVGSTVGDPSYLHYTASAEL